MRLIHNGVELEAGDRLVVTTRIGGHQLAISVNRSHLVITNDETVVPQQIEANSEGFEWVDDTPREDPNGNDTFEEILCAGKCGEVLEKGGIAKTDFRRTPLGLMCEACGKAFDEYTRLVMKALVDTHRGRMPAPPERLSKLIRPGGLDI